jgi:FkbM family methyltransferase
VPIEEIDGQWWPVGDVSCRPAILADVGMSENSWLNFATGRDVVIQAGGNCGIYPKMLSKHFKTVYTFEPDADNFNCLQLNATEPNIYAYPWALGEKAGATELCRVITNAGAHYMKGPGDIPVVTIDEMDYAGCNLIALDVEGAELLALKGAVNTIKRFKPAIIIEEKGHWVRYGQSTIEVKGWLQNQGYREISRCLRDTIWLAA